MQENNNNSEGKEILNNAMMWYIPKKDESKVKEVWEETRKVIKNGIRLQQKISQEITSGMVHRYQVVQVQE